MARRKVRIAREKSKATVLITPEAAAKEMELVRQCKDEVAWFGIVEETEGGDLLVTDILVPKQVVSAASVDSGREERADFSLAQFLSEHEDVAEQLRYFGHSHVDFGVTPSITDLDTIEDWSEYGIPYLINVIRNKRGEVYARKDVFEPTYACLDVDLVIATEQNSEIQNWAQKELKDKVEKKKWTSSYNPGPVMVHITDFGRIEKAVVQHVLEENPDIPITDHYKDGYTWAGQIDWEDRTHIQRGKSTYAEKGKLLEALNALTKSEIDKIVKDAEEDQDWEGVSSLMGPYM